MGGDGAAPFLEDGVEDFPRFVDVRAEGSGAEFRQQKSDGVPLDVGAEEPAPFHGLLLGFEDAGVADYVDGG